MLIAILSFLPLVRIDLFSVSKKYTYFKYLSVTLFIWSMIIGLSLVVGSSNILYFISLLKYPIIYLSTALAFVAFMHYLEIKIPNFLKIILWSFFTVNLIIAITNRWHLWFIKLAYSDTVTYQVLVEADTGWFFLFHTIVSYLLLLATVFMVIRKMYRTLKQEQDAFPFFLLVFTIIVGVLLNFVHVFIYTFTLDPTYIIFIVFVSFMYFIFYIRDVRLILRLNNHQFILDNLREMFMILNHRNEVVDASQSFQNKFSLSLDEGIPLKTIMREIEKKSVVYSSSKNIEYDEEKMYIHMKVKDINMPLLKHPGHMILFYDETKIQKYIHDMDYVMNHDLMTNLYNRNYLESIRDDFDQTSDYGCIIFDLDGLKLYNDYLGHNEGDRLLKRFASVLKDRTSANDSITPIRMGGDEFLLIINDVNQSKIQALVEKIHSETTDDNPLKNIGFSYGFAIQKKDEKLSTILSEADIKMYQMKATREKAKAMLEETLKKHAKEIQ